jgi:hypothetical protein
MLPALERRVDGAVVHESPRSGCSPRGMREAVHVDAAPRPVPERVGVVDQ